MSKNNYRAKVLAPISIKEHAEDDSLVIEGYANTVVKDRAGDVIPKSAWEKPSALGNYNKNPIILAYHDHSKPIGKAIDIYADEKGLKLKAVISKGAGDVYHLIKDGVLQTFSVGFAINDAKYVAEEDTFYINDVELHEVSVVSVPCNQDSVFTVSKSIENAEDFKKEFIQPTEAEVNEKDNEIMSTPNLSMEDILAAASAAAAKTVEDAEAKRALAAKEKAEKEAAAKAAADLIKTQASAAAKELVTSLEEKMAKDSALFAAEVKKNEETIVALKEEISALVNAGQKKFQYNAVAGATKDAGLRKEVSDAYLLGMLTKKGMETKYGSSVVQKLNQSSSIEVSSDSYETIFSTDLIRDIQAALVIAPLFREINMNAANLTIPVNPGRKNATWVTAAQYGTDNSSGGEITAALTEITLSTMKLAAKTYITDETSEDAIMPLLPLIRQHLVEAHANEIDRAFLLGTGTNQPKGLTVRAQEAETANDAGRAGGVEVSTATANGATPITAKMILKARKKMKLYGLNVRDITLVVSTEAYFSLVEDDAWADMDKVGSQAVKLNGQVGQIYGMPVIVSDQFDAPGASVPYAVLVNTMNFLVPRQRGVTVKTDFDVEKDRRVIVATQRLNLESLIRDGAGKDKGLVSVTYAA